MSAMDSLDPDRVEQLIARLEAMLGEQVTPTAVNPDGTPGNVVAGELIDAAWGNSVANTIAAILAPRAIVKTGTTPVPLTGTTPARIPALDLVIPNRGAAEFWLIAAHVLFQGNVTPQDFEFWFTSTGSATPRLISSGRFTVQNHTVGWWGGALIFVWSTATATGTTTIQTWAQANAGTGGNVYAAADRPVTAVAYNMGKLIP